MRVSALGRGLLSVPGLALMLVLLVGTAGAGLSVVSSWSAQRAIAQAVDSARVVSDLAIRRDLQPDEGNGVQTPDALDTWQIQQDVNMLHADRRLVGLEVWRVTGEPLFLDEGHPLRERSLPVALRVRARAGRVWVVQTAAGGRGVASIDVFLPYVDLRGDVAAVVKVLLPQQQLSAAIRTANRLFLLCASVLLAAVLGALLALRRRLRVREFQARHDPLTGLLNRTALLEDSQAVLGAATAERQAALLVIDLDGFKAINDTLGHAAGDALLSQVGATLRAAVRPGDLVARLGGDEFAVLLPVVPAGQDHAALGAQLLGRLRRTDFAVSGVSLAVDASVGVALCPDHGGSVQELLQHADVAMYQAKRAHAGTALYDPGTDHHDVGQLAVLVELRQALERDELVLHYQPQVDLATGAVTAVEALVRWQHPVRGLVPPDSFIPLAETTGLMQPLTEWVLRAAVAQAASWRETGAPLRVAVNISPRSLLEGDLPGTVLGLLAAHRLPAALLELEITETAVMTDPARAAGVLRHLHALGVSISIDDFGAGYTSLAYLRSLPVSTLKIDRSLVTHLVERAEDEAVTEAVIGLGHRLGLQVLAEGVETLAVYRRLTELGCDAVQGYLLTRPLPACALEGWLVGGWQPPAAGSGRGAATAGAPYGLASR